MAAPAVKWSNVALSFEPNVGQAGPEVGYVARGSTYTLYLSSGEMLLAAKNQSPLRMELVGANPSARMGGEDLQASTSNYFVGNDPSKWRSFVPNYGKVRFPELYPGIDLVCYGHDGNLEYDWIIAPGADPQKIRLVFDNPDRVRIDKSGGLAIMLGKNEYRHKKPVVYQEVAGKRIEVAGKWVLHGKEAGFRIGAYDRKQPLVIDPVLIYSTYLGGSGLDYAYAIAVDKVGNTYVTGSTGSTNFPTTTPLQGSLKGTADVFVTKINAHGSAKLYSTYLGGGGMDAGNGIAVDSQGEVYVTGSAGSFDFPMMGAIQGTWGGSGDAFLTKLNANGSALVYSTYLGGSAIDYGTGIALDPPGNAYITGVTFSTNFPTVNPFQATKGAQQDAFVAKINPGGTAWVYVTYLGGNNVDEGYGIAADTSGNAYVTGYTASTNFPLQSPYRSSNAASVDAFVTKINPAGSALVYSTYLGGSATDYGEAIAVDSSGNAYVTGVVGSTDFPVVNPMQLHLAGGDDAFVTKINPAGSALVYSTYLGGGSVDQPFALAIDQSGNAYVTGRTNSSDFPLTNAIQVTRFAFDMFVTELNAAGTARLFSTFLGGSGSESGRGIAVDGLGNIHIAGEGTSTNFPVVNAIQMTNGGGGGQDALVMLIGNNSPLLPYVFSDFAGNGRSGALLYDSSSGQSYSALSNGDGTFSYTSNLINAGFNILVTGDFNGDAKADLIVYNSQTGLAYIGIGAGDGTFQFQSLPWSPGWDTVATGDLNGDGKTDVALYNSNTGTIETGISNGNGTFTYTSHSLAQPFTFVRLADFTGDGKADLFLYRVTDGLASLGFGDGSGGFTFSPLSISAGFNLIDIGDLNGDGKADVMLYNGANGNAATGISNGTGGFTFTSLVFTPGFTSIRLADHTGDGNADVTVYNKNNGAAYFGTGTGTGTFNFQSLFWSPGYDFVIPEDVNGDGRADVILYNSATGTEYTGISNGDGTFAYIYSLWGPGKVLARDTASVATPPAGTIGVGPSSGSGSVQTFTATYAAAGGYQDLKWVQMLLAVAPDGGGQPYCLVHYDVQGNKFWLYSDILGFFVGPIAPGAASNQLQGSLCALNTSGSSVSVGAVNLTINPNLVFKKAKALNIYMRAYTLEGADSGWVVNGTWTTAAAAPGTMTVAPSSGTVTNGTQHTFTLTYPDTPGFAGAAFGWEQFLIAVASNGGAQPFCFVHYDRAGNGLWMYSSDVGFYLGPVTPGTASNVLSSSACSVNTGSSAAQNTGGNLVLTVPITLKSPMIGAQKLFQHALTVLNVDTGFVQSGTLTVN